MLDHWGSAMYVHRGVIFLGSFIQPTQFGICCWLTNLSRSRVSARFKDNSCLASHHEYDKIPVCFGKVVGYILRGQQLNILSSLHKQR